MQIFIICGGEGDFDFFIVKGHWDPGRMEYVGESHHHSKRQGV